MSKPGCRNPDSVAKKNQGIYSLVGRGRRKLVAYEDISMCLLANELLLFIVHTT